MNENEAWQIVGVLTAETTGWNDVSAQTYMHEIMAWSDSDAAMAAVRNVCRTWIERSRPPFAVIDEAYRVEIRERSAQMGIAPGRPLCDGTGWTESSGGMLPCPRCNPYLAIIFQSPERLIRWRNGTPTKHLVDLDGSPLPTPCQVTNLIDPEDPIVPPSVGRMIAWSAYVADCNERGVESMDRTQFMRRLGTVKPQPERTP